MYAEPGDMYVQELRAAKSPCSKRSPLPTPDPCVLCPLAQEDFGLLLCLMEAINRVTVVLSCALGYLAYVHDPEISRRVHDAGRGWC